MFIFCKDIKKLEKYEIRSIIATLQEEIDSRAPELNNVQLAMAKGLLNEGLRIGLVKELRVWFPDMDLRTAKYAMEALEREHGPNKE